MKLTRKKVSASGIRFSLNENGKEVARAYLYLMRNDLHEKPFGLLEDVFVAEEKRGKGLGRRLVRAVIREAKRRGCYKLVALSREERGSVHRLYRDLGFQDWGREFRLSF